MKLEGENVLLRIFINIFQKWHHRPVYEAIVETARKEQMSGATVLEALEGFGQNGNVLKENLMKLSSDREVIVEIVDTPEKIEAFLRTVEPMIRDAVVTTERAYVVHYRHAERGES